MPIPESKAGPPPAPPPLPPPAPPPLPPPLVSARQPGAISNAPHPHSFESEGIIRETPRLLQDVYQPTYYFFYGTLTRPAILKDVLGLSTDPVLRPGTIHGYALAKWGDYYALIPSEPGSVVAGSAYLVQSAEHESRLAYYETNSYTVTDCLVHFDIDSLDVEGAGESAHGKTFVYAGDAVALKEARFDRVLWEARMGRKLPREWRTGGSGDAEVAR